MVQSQQRFIHFLNFTDSPLPHLSIDALQWPTLQLPSTERHWVQHTSGCVQTVKPLWTLSFLLVLIKCLNRYHYWFELMCSLNYPVCSFLHKFMNWPLSFHDGSCDPAVCQALKQVVFHLHNSLCSLLTDTSTEQGRWILGSGRQD